LTKTQVKARVDAGGERRTISLKRVGNEAVFTALLSCLCDSKWRGRFFPKSFSAKWKTLPENDGVLDPSDIESPFAGEALPKPNRFLDEFAVLTDNRVSFRISLSFGIHSIGECALEGTRVVPMSEGSFFLLRAHGTYVVSGLQGDPEEMRYWCVRDVDGELHIIDGVGSGQLSVIDRQLIAEAWTCLRKENG
jgi:hypothetical protein